MRFRHVALLVVVVLMLSTGALWLASLSNVDRTLEVIPAQPTQTPMSTPQAVDTQAPTAPVAIAYQPDPQWVARVAAKTGIPSRALVAYASAQLRVSDEQKTCKVGWNTLAAIGGIESGHGSFGGAVLRDDGWTDPVIVGPELSGGKFGVIRDTDGGTLDGDKVWDRAVGPMQFIPQTWTQWAADGNDDGQATPGQIDDAALAAARYLCHSGNLSNPDVWRRAIFSFNHSDQYVASIASLAITYAKRASAA